MFIYEKSDHAMPITLVTENSLSEMLNTLPGYLRDWFEFNRFAAKAGEFCLLPGEDGSPEGVLAGFDRQDVLWAVADLPSKLPAGEYYLQGELTDDDLIQASVGWGLGQYRFDQYRREENRAMPVLYVGFEQLRIQTLVDSVTLVRNLINTPANHMMPQDLEQVMSHMADRYGADLSVVKGPALLQENFPAIHAVGRASAHAPRLLELNWGDEEDPLITLVGKGVCFDTGGLDLKSSANMRIMKKDMGGAAHVLGLANMIMQMDLPLSLQVLIPAVDNAISGDAYRPGDVLNTRAGKTVEVDNTDAEGRIVLSDALTYAAEFNPDVLIDFATLTGAARVALGTEIPVFFSNSRSLMQKLQIASTTSNELIWNLPLHKPYFEKLKSNVADMMNSGDAYGGAITAALFLNEFVPGGIPWAHFDVMAWNLRQRPGRPVGGEAMGLFAVLEYLEENFLE
ncbi:MAG: leucyl aminopeptidase family protein [Thiolinea sp.]